jgi:predicted NBD/HSP70 family sugar kinase
MLWGIDLGGTKIEGIVIDGPEAKQIVARHRIDTESQGGYEHILSRIQSVIDELTRLSGKRPDRIGIGTPGILDPSSGLLKNSNTLCLNGKPVNHDLGKKLSVPVSMANDANCFALAEYHLGAGKNFPEAKNMFGVIMGTGVGGGIVINGKIITGYHGIGGEWGHMTLDTSGDLCYCGRKGCVETWISGPALQRYYKQITGTQKKVEDIFAEPDQKDTLQVKERLLTYYGRALGQVITFLDPDLVVLGGGLSNLKFLYTEGRPEVAKNIFNHSFLTPVVPAALGDSAGVFGAALL